MLTIMSSGIQLLIDEVTNNQNHFLCFVAGICRGEDAIIEESTVDNDIGASREASRTGKIVCNFRIY